MGSILLKFRDYTVNEQLPAGWIVDSIECSKDLPVCEIGSITVTPEPGQTGLGSMFSGTLDHGVELGSPKPARANP